jgi:hypothetical protein
MKLTLSTPKFLTSPPTPIILNIPTRESLGSFMTILEIVCPPPSNVPIKLLPATPIGVQFDVPESGSMMFSVSI